MTVTSLSVSATALGVLKVTGAFDAFSAAHGIAPAVVQAVQVAMDELLSNTVRCGFPPGRTGRIDVRFDVSGGALDVLLVDDGVAFDPLERKDPDTGASLEDRPVGGLGIYLVKQLMDSVQYERRDGRNRLRLRKEIIKS